MKTLYKLDAKGKVRVWQIWGEGDTVYISHGLENGTRIREEIHIPYALAGRTLEEQVQLRIESRIKKRLDSGCVWSKEGLGGDLKNQLGLERQMKAVLLKDGRTPDEVLYNARNTPSMCWLTAFVQRKYNGHRCTITRLEGHTVAYSSSGKLITSISHILKAVNVRGNQKLDGELYVHGLSLQKIGSKVRTEGVTDTDLKFVCFDQILDKPFKERRSEIPIQNSIYIIMAETIQVRTFDEVKRLFHKFRAEGYEGAMLRHGEMEYECGRRSKSIFKIKKCDGAGYYDEEFNVVRILTSKEGWARLVCETEEGKRFRCSAPGNFYEKTETLKNKHLYIGKKVRVEFPEWTDAGVPSQPVAIMFRDKENE